MIYLSTALQQANEFTSGAQKWWYGYGFKYNNNPPKDSVADALAAMYPSTYTASYLSRVKNYIKNGYYLIDCSGLVCRCLMISDIGSSQIATLPSRDGNYTEHSLSEVIAGDILWRSGHVALAISDKLCVEARGIDYGVIQSEIAKRDFTKVIRPTYYYYENLGWNKDDEGWWYAYGRRKGEYYWNCTAWINDKLYAFDKEGYMVYNPSVKTDDSGAITSISGYRASNII